MSRTNAGLSVKEAFETGDYAIPGTVYAMPNNGMLPKPEKNTIPSIDAVNTLLSSLSCLQNEHQACRKSHFNQGLPFYTCLNALENLWQKELPDGSIFQVTRTYDWENDRPVEKELKKIR